MLGLARERCSGLGLVFGLGLGPPHSAAKNVNIAWGR